VDLDSGRIHLERAVVAVDVGQIVNPDGLSKQLEGAFIQSASWTLNEQVAFDRHGITSTDWRSYPIIRFGDAPAVETVLLDRPGQPFLGVGEGAQGPAAAAIANAVYDAAGIRLRQLPFTPERVQAALSSR
jgi:CO/xanthine dehydrogenase Mo-binding subunit